MYKCSHSVHILVYLAMRVINLILVWYLRAREKPPFIQIRMMDDLCLISAQQKIDSCSSMLATISRQLCVMPNYIDERFYIYV